MLLAVDIGNSSIDFGVFGEDGRLLAKSKLSTVKTKSTDEYAAILSGILPLNGVDPKKISAAILSSVVPLVTSAISRAVRKLCGVTPMEVGPGVKTGLKIKIDMQNQLGADIVANAVATVAAFPPPAVIVDIGTATTFTVIDKEGILDGVIIAPGLRVSMDALASSASELPDAPLVAPQKLIGPHCGGAEGREDEHCRDGRPCGAGASALFLTDCRSGGSDAYRPSPVVSEKPEMTG